jgi:hypothetical protein
VERPLKEAEGGSRSPVEWNAAVLSFLADDR